ncbi:MAG: hypothetical protein P4M12_04160, partial [Gammaproteobacteria bacterium]|nr:hypothetical protein [Gammaproteobacteria bacterium]
MQNRNSAKVIKEGIKLIQVPTIRDEFERLHSVADRNVDVLSESEEKEILKCLNKLNSEINKIQSTPFASNPKTKINLDEFKNGSLSEIFRLLRLPSDQLESMAIFCYIEQRKNDFFSSPFNRYRDMKFDNEEMQRIFRILINKITNRNEDLTPENLFESYYSFITLYNNAKSDIKSICTSDIKDNEIIEEEKFSGTPNLHKFRQIIEGDDQLYKIMFNRLYREELIEQLEQLRLEINEKNKEKIQWITKMADFHIINFIGNLRKIFSDNSAQDSLAIVRDGIKQIKNIIGDYKNKNPDEKVKQELTNIYHTFGTTLKNNEQESRDHQKHFETRDKVLSKKLNYFLDQLNKHIGFEIGEYKDSEKNQLISFINVDAKWTPAQIELFFTELFSPRMMQKKARKVNDEVDIGLLLSGTANSADKPKVIDIFLKHKEARKFFMDKYKYKLKNDMSNDIVLSLNKIAAIPDLPKEIEVKFEIIKNIGDEYSTKEELDKERKIGFLNLYIDAYLLGRKQGLSKGDDLTDWFVKLQEIFKTDLNVFLKLENNKEKLFRRIAVEAGKSEKLRTYIYSQATVAIEKLNKWGVINALKIIREMGTDAIKEWNIRIADTSQSEHFTLNENKDADENKESRLTKKYENYQNQKSKRNASPAKSKSASALQTRHVDSPPFNRAKSEITFAAISPDFPASSSVGPVEPKAAATDLAEQEKSAAEFAMQLLRQKQQQEKEKNNARIKPASLAAQTAPVASSSTVSAAAEQQVAPAASLQEIPLASQIKLPEMGVDMVWMAPANSQFLTILQEYHGVKRDVTNVMDVSKLLKEVKELKNILTNPMINSESLEENKKTYMNDRIRDLNNIKKNLNYIKKIINERVLEKPSQINMGDSLSTSPIAAAPVVASSSVPSSVSSSLSSSLEPKLPLSRSTLSLSLDPLKTYVMPLKPIDVESDDNAEPASPFVMVDESSSLFFKIEREKLKTKRQAFEKKELAFKNKQQTAFQDEHKEDLTQEETELQLEETALAHEEAELYKKERAALEDETEKLNNEEKFSRSKSGPDTSASSSAAEDEMDVTGLDIPLTPPQALAAQEFARLVNPLLEYVSTIEIKPVPDPKGYQYEALISMAVESAHAILINSLGYLNKIKQNGPQKINQSVNELLSFVSLGINKINSDGFIHNEYIKEIIGYLTEIKKQLIDLSHSSNNEKKVEPNPQLVLDEADKYVESLKLNLFHLMRTSRSLFDSYYASEKEKLSGKMNKESLSILINTSQEYLKNLREVNVVAEKIESASRNPADKIEARKISVEYIPKIKNLESLIQSYLSEASALVSLAVQSPISEEKHDNKLPVLDTLTPEQIAKESVELAEKRRRKIEGTLNESIDVELQKVSHEIVQGEGKIPPLDLYNDKLKKYLEDGDLISALKLCDENISKINRKIKLHEYYNRHSKKFSDDELALNNLATVSTEKLLEEYVEIEKFLVDFIQYTKTPTKDVLSGLYSRLDVIKISVFHKEILGNALTEFVEKITVSQYRKEANQFRKETKIKAASERLQNLFKDIDNSELKSSEDSLLLSKGKKTLLDILIDEGIDGIKTRYDSLLNNYTKKTANALLNSVRAYINHLMTQKDIKEASTIIGQLNKYQNQIYDLIELQNELVTKREEIKTIKAYKLNNSYNDRELAIKIAKMNTFFEDKLIKAYYPIAGKPMSHLIDVYVEQKKWRDEYNSLIKIIIPDNHVTNYILPDVSKLDTGFSAVFSNNDVGKVSRVFDAQPGDILITEMEEFSKVNLKIIKQIDGNKFLNIIATNASKGLSPFDDTGEISAWLKETLPKESRKLIADFIKKYMLLSSQLIHEGGILRPWVSQYLGKELHHAINEFGLPAVRHQLVSGVANSIFGAFPQRDVAAATVISKLSTMQLNLTSTCLNKFKELNDAVVKARMAQASMLLSKFQARVNSLYSNPLQDLNKLTAAMDLTLKILKQELTAENLKKINDEIKVLAKNKIYTDIAKDMTSLLQYLKKPALVPTPAVRSQGVDTELVDFKKAAADKAAADKAAADKAAADKAAADKAAADKAAADKAAA